MNAPISARADDARPLLSTEELAARLGIKAQRRVIADALNELDEVCLQAVSAAHVTSLLRETCDTVQTALNLLFLVGPRIDADGGVETVQE